MIITIFSILGFVVGFAVGRIVVSFVINQINIRR